MTAIREIGRAFERELSVGAQDAILAQPVTSSSPRSAAST